MTYLYGDSSPSPLEANYVDFVRLAIDQSVEILRAQDRMVEESASLAERERQAAALGQRLEEVARSVVGVVDPLGSEELDVHVARLRETILRSVEEALRREVSEVQAELAREAARCRATKVAEQRKVAGAVAALLLAHDLPGMQGELRVELGADAQYCGVWRARTGYGVAVSISLEVPEESLFVRDLRVQQVSENLEIHSPEMAGWLRKEPRMTPHRVGKLHVISLAISSSEISAELRATIELNATGYDIGMDRAKRAITIARIEGGETHPFEIYPDDEEALLEFMEDLGAAARDIQHHRKALIEARLDGTPLDEHERPSELVERIMREAAPMVHEIARHSPPDELVLRRLLGGNRREEIFVTKRELVERVLALPQAHWGLFTALDLGVPRGVAGAAEVDRTAVPEPVDAYVATRPQSEMELSAADLLPIEAQLEPIEPGRIIDDLAMSAPPASEHPDDDDLPDESAAPELPSVLVAPQDDDSEHEHVLEATEPPEEPARASLDPLMVDEMAGVVEDAWERDDAEPGPFEPQAR